MPLQADAPASKRLLRARERAGYADACEVADAFGWPDYPLDEGGERMLTAARAKLYAHAFHVDPEWLLSGGEEPARPEKADSTIADVPEPTDELTQRLGRLTSAQRVALIEFLRTMQEG